MQDVEQQADAYSGPAAETPPARPDSRLLCWAGLGLLLAFHLCANLLWHRIDNRPVHTDEEAHMVGARNYYEAFTSPEYESSLERLIAITKVKPLNPVHPPLLHLTGAVMIMLFGYSTDIIALTGTFYFLLALLGCFLLLRTFLPPWQALFCVLVISFTPILYASSRFFMTDFTSMAMVVWALYALVRTEFFQNTYWVFAFAIFNGLTILSRTNGFLFYLVPCGILVLYGLVVAWRAGATREARGIAFRRWLFNCVLTGVVTIGVFTPWYFQNLSYFYDFWLLDHLGGQGGPLVQFDGESYNESFDKREQLERDLSRALVPEHESLVYAASVAPNPLRVAATALEALTAQTNTPAALKPLLHPRVPWSRYPIFMVNNALFLPLFLLSIAGMLCALLVPRFRNRTTVVLLLGVLGSWILMTILFKYSNPRYSLPIIPALGAFAGMAVMALQPALLRRIAGTVVALFLVFQYIHFSFFHLLPVERVDLPIKVEYDTAKFRDPGLAVIKDDLLISFSFSPIGHPVQQNFKDMVLESLARAERSRPVVTGEYANFQRLNIRGFDLDQQHYWPLPNPYLRRGFPADQLPQRKLRSIGMGREPEDLLPRLGATDYILYAARPHQLPEEPAWQRFFQERGFVLFDRFEVQRIGNFPTRVFGIMMRKPEGELLVIDEAADIERLNLENLYNFIYSDNFDRLDPELQRLARSRMEALVSEMELYGLNAGIALVKMTMSRAEAGWFEASFLLKVMGEMDRDYQLYFTAQPEDPELLPEGAREQGLLDLTFNPVPPTREWKVGEYVMLKRRFEAQEGVYLFTAGFIESPDKAYGIPAQTQVDLGSLPP